MRLLPRSTITSSGNAAQLTLSCVAREYGEVERLLDEAARYLGGQEFELVRTRRDVVTLD